MSPVQTKPPVPSPLPPTGCALLVFCLSLPREVRVPCGRGFAEFSAVPRTGRSTAGTKGIDAEHTRSILGICISEASSWKDRDGTRETQVVWSRQTSSRETYTVVLVLLCVTLKDFLFCQVQSEEPAEQTCLSIYTIYTYTRPTR